MRKLVFAVTMAVIFGLSGVALAQDQNPDLDNECVYIPGSKVCEQNLNKVCGNGWCNYRLGENRKTCPEDCNKPKKKVKKAEVPCQVCPQGEKGDEGNDGDVGPQGEKGNDGAVGECVECECEDERSPVRLGFGAMANGIWPTSEYSWAVGPALQLQIDLDDEKRHELTLGGAYMPYMDGGVALELGYTYYLVDNDEGHYWFGLGLNVYGAKSGLTMDDTDGTYVGASPALVFRPDLGWGVLRFEVGPYLGAAIYDFKGTKASDVYGSNPTDFSIGVQGSAFLAWYW